ncbi:sensor histidine kinase [Polymorphobacter fuscus]|uniref:histidine kinase n=1 Tax=Sandarakinorhabdus fusca TaxID=1439888 RepID=A0A7C9GQ61_9SPHN|nr:ATP-binding protein [Polymorphobacter fuscus]KAB7646173.1 ATPase [Polymorphobacter fuscus]MQT17376.1 ATPase [Polymorphobacter fuscus]NJC10090.1 signal transduction histidine kinase [Polymorphobacter fuscus]
MVAYLQKLLGSTGLAPHGYCLLWDPVLIWTHVLADAVIGLSYFSIPVALAVFLTRRPDMRFRWIAWLFVAFILACGATHFMAIWTLWNPDYGAQALLKLATAIISVATAVALWPLLPRTLALPSPAQLEAANAALQLRIDERDTALAALAAQTEERMRAEAMLRQAQKMDAVGQLTAGIAHDFNNLLTVVIGNIDRARRLSGQDSITLPALENAMTGAQSAARLTDQLLAFARQQPLLPALSDLNAITDRILTLFNSMIDPSITVDVALAPDLWPVQIDTGQAENAVLNLLVNARDAMRHGGQLRVLTRNQPDPDGDRVVLQVTDTGQGMDEATRERIFEPFFTTKTLGRGSGLGLSQVYGFVTQSKGSVTIDSAPGEGATISVYLPRAMEGR